VRMSASDSTASVSDANDLEKLVDLEQQFYETGYAEGLADGKVQGHTEGRQFGAAKGFEMWEELGFYEGFAKVWKTFDEDRSDSKDTSQVVLTATLLLDLISRFPVVNPPADDPSDLDVAKLFSQIRTRYKKLCALIGVKPSLRANQASSADDAETTIGAQPNSARKAVWRIDSRPDGDLSF